jgi:polyhydroxyalkanoate synthesis regulator phasin
MIVLEQTLNALGPNVSSEAQKLKSQYSQALQHFSTLRQQDQETITALRGQVDNLNAQIPVLQNQLVVLKAQLLETTNAAGKPKG